MFYTGILCSDSDASPDRSVLAPIVQFYTDSVCFGPCHWGLLDPLGVSFALVTAGCREMYPAFGAFSQLHVPSLKAFAKSNVCFFVMFCLIFPWSFLRAIDGETSAFISMDL